MPETTAIARAFIAALPHSTALGMRLEEIGQGSATIAMPYDPALVGDPVTQVIHGGAVSALMDTACGAAVMCHLQAGISTATLDLRIDYMRPATPGQTLRTRAECHHVTRSVAFVRAVTTDDDESRPVAMATGAFTVERGT
ncbi:MAG: PaaI family thioesterase [Pseudomonadota bacterium]